MTIVCSRALEIARRSKIVSLHLTGLAAGLLLLSTAIAQQTPAVPSFSPPTQALGQSLTASLAAGASSAAASRSVESIWQAADQQLGDGQLARAERMLREAAAASTDEAHRGGTALRLGVVLTARGQLAAAREQLAQARELKSMLAPGDRVLVPQAFGALEVRERQFPAAERSFDEAAEMARAQDMPEIEARSRVNALRARMDARDIAGLEERLAALDALISTLPPGESTAVLLIASGELHRRAVNEFRSPAALNEMAFKSFERARAMAETDGTRSFAVGYLGALYEDAGRYDEALALTAQAVFLAQAAGSQDALYFWEWQEARIERARGQLPASAAAIDRAVASLSPIRADLLQSTPGAFSRVVEPVYLEYADVNLRIASTMDEGGEEQQAVLRGVRDQLETLKQAEIQDYFADECVAADAEEGIDYFDVPGAAVVYPILLADRTEVLVESGGVLKSFSTEVPRGRATAAARRLRVALERSGSGDAYLEPARELYDWLLADAEGWLAANDVTTLVFVPSGALRTIPLGALHNGSGFLIERYAVATTPAVSLVTSVDARGIERLFIAGLTESVQGFSALPSVSREIETVSTIFPAESLKDQSFQRAEVEARLSTGGFSAAHLATHGKFSADHRESFILTYDDRLTMDGLQSALSLRGDESLDLLVLSACETASGDDRAALGLAGVAVQSGASSAIASLWFISDAATADLMDRFYTNLKTGETSKAESLRQAQLALMASPDFQHPSYWAPYLLIGNWL